MHWICAAANVCYHSREKHCLETSLCLEILARVISKLQGNFSQQQHPGPARLIASLALQGKGQPDGSQA